MRATDGETPEVEAPSGELEGTPGDELDSLKVPETKKKKKSPTPGARGHSLTRVRGRSRTPVDLYMNRRSGTPTGAPSTWRSITPFLRREEREKTPFELGKDIKAQLIINMVFDKACVMDITEAQEPAARYITSDISVIDRAAVMDISNVEVIYVVEEYEEEPEEEEFEEEVVVVKKKGKGKKGARKDRASKESMEKLLQYYKCTP